MRLRIWHTINIPRPAFHFEVPDVPTAIGVLDTLAAYDNFLGDGEDQPWSTVAGRRDKQRELAGDNRQLLSMLRRYNDYLLEHSPSGVLFVHNNVQGLEAFEDDEWCEYHDEEGRDIDELRRMAHAKYAGEDGPDDP